MNLATGAPFDAAPFGRPLDGETGLVWDDPREFHRVVACFAGAPPDGLELQYWRTRWPEQRLPKDRIPVGGEFGWWELGNWYTGTWQTADTGLSIESNTAVFRFRPIDEREFPDLSGFGAQFRTTLKVRLTAAGGLERMTAIEAYTDSTWDRLTVTVLWEDPPRSEPSFSLFNGHLEAFRKVSPRRYTLTLCRTRNPDPNTFDRTLLTVRGNDIVTVRVDDLVDGPVYVPDYQVCVVGGEPPTDYVGVCSAIRISHPRGVHDAVEGLPEQTWSRAWDNMVPKRKRLYLPLGTDGGRHRFGLDPDGSVFYRTNNHYLVRCPGRDTPRLQDDSDRVRVSFGLPGTPVGRTILDGVLPIGMTEWHVEGVRVQQRAFATVLGGTDPQGAPPPGDAFGVLIAGFTLTNQTDREAHALLSIRFTTRDVLGPVALDAAGLVWSGDRLRGEVRAEGDSALSTREGIVECAVDLPAKAERDVVVKLPYVWLRGEEVDALRRLGFDVELRAVSGYWRARLGEGMRLITPEVMLNQFHQAHAAHLLVNCERSPDGATRIARVGSFNYGAYGNESCMMIVDLDRRGYHREARECLAAFLRSQGTVGLPGDFSSQDGVLYGAAGYECGGYNQHHGWILWCLIEHYRFTRDDAWLGEVAPRIIAAAEWIIRERGRTLDRADIGRGLLPHGGLEDIGDWWQWLSTNAYTWRGLDAAAWALEQLGHRGAERVEREASAYRGDIVSAFTEASRRSPVVRLRDGTCVPHFPSHVHRRGRSFGWICETLEGAIHLLISGVIDPTCREAGWILRDYEDNLYLSDHYGYRVDDYEAHWFDRGGFSMQSCLLLGVEPYLHRDEARHALRAAFNAIAAGYFADTRMLTEHALPRLGDWRGDHYKSSDEANAAGWLRYLFVREQGRELLLGQAVPRRWLKPGRRVGVENAATHFGPISLIYESSSEAVTATLHGPVRNPPARIRVRFRLPDGRKARAFTVNGTEWPDHDERWVYLPGDVGSATVTAVLS